MNKYMAWIFIGLLSAFFFIMGFFMHKAYLHYTTETKPVIIEKVEPKTNFETSFRFTNLW